MRLAGRCEQDLRAGGKKLRIEPVAGFCQMTLYLQKWGWEMAVYSMTGYGYGQAGDQIVVTEMFVNQRYSDFHIAFPEAS